MVKLFKGLFLLKGMVKKIKIDQEKCIGCGLCLSICSEYFDMKDDKAVVKKSDIEKKDSLKEAITSCPVEAIKTF